MNRRFLLAGFVVAALAGLSLAAVLQIADGESDWKGLSSIDVLRDQFNRDKGSIRILLLLSPT